MAKTERPDWAAMIMPLGRVLMAVERPILDSHGLTMWAYSVLLALGKGPARGQGVLADEIGADKTRIIAVLDDLQERGLIERYPDPTDRRARLLALTPEGHRRSSEAQAEIQAAEHRMLSRLPEADRRGFLNTLMALSTLPREEIVGGDAASS